MSRLRKEYSRQNSIVLDPKIEAELGNLIPKESYITVQNILALMQEVYPGDANPAAFRKILQGRCDYEETNEWWNEQAWSPINRRSLVDYCANDLTVIGHHNSHLAYLFMQDPNLKRFLPDFEQQEHSRWERTVLFYQQNLCFDFAIFSWLFVGVPLFLVLVFVLLGAGFGVAPTLAITSAITLTAIPTIFFGLNEAFCLLREWCRNTPLSVKEHANAYAKTHNLPSISNISMFRLPKNSTDTPPPSYQESQAHPVNPLRQYNDGPPPYKEWRSSQG